MQYNQSENITYHQISSNSKKSHLLHYVPIHDLFAPSPFSINVKQSVFQLSNHKHFCWNSGRATMELARTLCFFISSDSGALTDRGFLGPASLLVEGSVIRLTTWHVWNPVNNEIYTISTWSRIFFHQQYMNSSPKAAFVFFENSGKTPSLKKFKWQVAARFSLDTPAEVQNFKGCSSTYHVVTQRHKHKTKWCAKLPPLGGSQGLANGFSKKKNLQNNRTLNEQRCDASSLVSFGGKWESEIMRKTQLKGQLDISPKSRYVHKSPETQRFFRSVSEIGLTPAFSSFLTRFEIDFLSLKNQLE